MMDYSDPRGTRFGNYCLVSGKYQQIWMQTYWFAVYEECKCCLFGNKTGHENCKNTFQLPTAVLSDNDNSLVSQPDSSL